MEERRDTIAICTMWEQHKTFRYHLKGNRNVLGDRFGNILLGELEILRKTGGSEEIVGFYGCGECDAEHIIEVPYHKGSPQWARVGRVLTLGHFKQDRSAHVRLRLDATGEEDMTLVHDLDPYHAANKIGGARHNGTLGRMKWYLWFDVEKGVYSLGSDNSPYGYSH